MNSDKSCSVHPIEPVVGVCHLCLNERLLELIMLANNRSQHHHRSLSNSQNNYTSSLSTKTINQEYKNTRIKAPNIFAFASSVLSRSRCYSHDASATPDQDSFISMKFENSGVVSWEKGNSFSKVSLDHCNISWNNSKTTKPQTTTNNRKGRTVIKHAETPCGVSIRWRKRIGHMFQFLRWKRSPSHGANRGTRTLSKRRTTE